jgi:hypothetical protein
MIIDASAMVIWLLLSTGTQESVSVIKEYQLKQDCDDAVSMLKGQHPKWYNSRPRFSCWAVPKGKGE